MRPSVGLFVLCSTANIAAAGEFGIRFAIADGVTNLSSPIHFSTQLYQSSLPGSTTFGGPSPAAIDAFPQNEFDSYVGIDTRPSAGGDPAIKNDGYHANPGDLGTIGVGFTGSFFSALWYLDPGGSRPQVNAVPNQFFGGQYAVFIGRFSFRTTDGTAPEGSVNLGPFGMNFDVIDTATRSAGPSNTDSLLIQPLSFDVPVMIGVDGADLSVHATANAYAIKLHSFEAQVGPNRFLVNDLYLVAIPSPGVPGVLALAAPLLLRRRRAS